MSWAKSLLAVLGLAAAGTVGFLAWQSLAPPALPAGIVAANGRIEAERIDISAKTTGRVASMTVREGDWIEAGSEVARLDTLEVEAQLRQAEAQVLQARQQKLQAQALLAQRQSELA